MVDECSPNILAQGRPRAFSHWRMDPLFLLGEISNWYHNTQWNYFFISFFIFSLCANSIRISKKNKKKSGKHYQHEQKYPATNHNQDNDFLRGKPSNEKGKTTGPSPAKKISLLNKEFTTIFTNTNAKNYQNIEEPSF